MTSAFRSCAFASGFVFSNLICMFPSPGLAAEAPASLKTALQTASQGAIVNLGGLNAAFLTEPANLSRTWAGSKLMFSDSPESPTGSGNLYIDSFAANTSVRVYLYHVNGASSNKKFNIVVRNTGTAAATLQRTKAGLAGPSTDYIYCGKVAAQRYLASAGLSNLTINPNQCVVLDSSMNAAMATPGQLVHGIYDITANQPFKVYCLMTDPSTDAAAVAPTLAVLARDTHVRGTFVNCDKIVDAPLFTSDGMFQVALADGTTDAYVTGTDAINGTSETNSGNYGVVYRFHFTTYGDDGRKMGFLLNPRAGALGSAVNCAAGITPTGAALVPSGTTEVSSQSDCGVACKYQPVSGGTSVWIQWMPCGGSSLPAKLLPTPY